MVKRGALIVLVALFAVACQSSGDVPSSVAPLTSVAEAEGDAPQDEAATPGQDASDTTSEPEPLPEAPEPAPHEAAPPEVAPTRIGGTNAVADNDTLNAAVLGIARLEKAKGSKAALNSVFECYSRAQSPKVTLAQAQVCAVQDFVVSRYTENQLEERYKNRAPPRALVVARRAPQRIGALMELKNMRQSQFNAFGRYMTGVALPTYEQAIK